MVESRPPKVFVIDDEIDLLQLTAEGLELEGFETDSALGGIEGLQRVRESLPDIVVCDINMPDMNGYEVLEALRNDSLTANIPFIFLTARTDPTEIRKGMEHGADDYLTKPVNIADLIQAIHSRLNRQAHLEMKRLRDFAQELVIAQETERRNFANLLRHNFVEKLSDLKMSLDSLLRLSGNNPSQALQTANRLASDTLDALNKLSYTLWPAMLSQLGLEAALISLIDQLQTDADFTVQFDYYGLEAVSDPNMTIMLYRIVQEALNNCKDHARVNQAVLKLWLEGGKIYLQIEDTGTGFDVQAAGNLHGKIGLQSMVERTRLLNGELAIISAPQSGTKIYGSFPLVERLETPSKRPLAEIQASPAEEMPMKSAALRLAIADSSEVNRWGYRAIIEQAVGFKVVSELADWKMLRRFLEDVEVDILLLSHALDGEEKGLLAIQDLHELHPKLKILLLSNYTEYAFAAQALKNGVAAYLLKSSSSAELRNALEALAAGKQYLSQELLLQKQRNQSITANNNTIDAFSTLTEREREIFYRVVNGQSNLEIASELVISSRTVETHRLNMMRKLGLSGTAALINFAINKGLLGNA